MLDFSKFVSPFLASKSTYSLLIANNYRLWSQYPNSPRPHLLPKSPFSSEKSFNFLIASFPSPTPRKSKVCRVCSNSQQTSMILRKVAGWKWGRQRVLRWAQSIDWTEIVADWWWEVTRREPGMEIVGYGPLCWLSINRPPRWLIYIRPSNRSNSIDDPLARGQRAVETVKIIVGMQIDDATFRNQLLESGVLSTKDFAKWTFEILFELFEGGPLLNPRRLDEAMRATKFMKRLLGFYQPYNYRYSSLRKTHVRLSSSSFQFLLMRMNGETGIYQMDETSLCDYDDAFRKCWWSSVSHWEQVTTTNCWCFDSTRSRWFASAYQLQFWSYW